MLKLKNADDEKSKLKLKEGNKRISEINSEALALSLAYNNAAFLFTVVLLAFFIMRSAPPPPPYCCPYPCPYCTLPAPSTHLLHHAVRSALGAIHVPPRPVHSPRPPPPAAPPLSSQAGSCPAPPPKSGRKHRPRALTRSRGQERDPPDELRRVHRPRGRRVLHPLFACQVGQDALPLRARRRADSGGPARRARHL